MIVPYLRGYGKTRFLDSATPRSGEQAALGADLLALMDALGISEATLAGYDWGGRAACVVAALWPTIAARTRIVQQLQHSEYCEGFSARRSGNERRLWYQYFFHSERGRAALQQDRNAADPLPLANLVTHLGI